ncbi:hypothetical protein ACFX4N_23805 [Priestia sp. YIM B13551]|uniref:hypothetical protein n=1 Tax=Priestia sp. YIM B13551 TaxID=3366306 RepID=UPI0036726463
MAFVNGVRNLAKIGLQGTQKGMSKATEPVKKTSVKAAKKVAKTTFIDVKNKDGEVQKNLANFYTGKKLNPVHAAALGGAYLGGQSMYQSLQKQTITPLKLATMNDYQEIGAPDIMMYDGVGQDRAPKNLNADGSIVFGLHNMRKG